MARPRRVLVWVARGLAALVIVALLAAGGGALLLRSRLNGSLPIEKGDVALAGLSAPVRIDLDAQGVPLMQGANRHDLARATGFLHAQNRFFQMDLLRRRAAGELAELLGPVVLEEDRKARTHRMREVARRAVAAAPAETRAFLQAYSEGVNAGLSALRSSPFEYLLLRAPAAQWRLEDSLLGSLAMFMLLTEDGVDMESSLGVMHDLLPAGLFAFLTQQGSPWDAPVIGGALPAVAIPGPDVIDMRRIEAASLRGIRGSASEDEATGSARALGSNNWAVSGALTGHGGALLASDMHLPIGVPNTWYRLSLEYPDGRTRRRVTGVTLPGTPTVVSGSNGHVAWAFTNTQGDWSDLVVLELAPGDENSYLTPDGPRRFEHREEVIKVKGAPDERLDVVSTTWGPVYDTDHRGRKRALRWIAHDTEAVNASLLAMERAGTLEEAQRAGNLSGIPPQNLLVATADGRIGWTIAGRIPRRLGHNGRLPASWADGSRRWEGYLTPEDYPRLNDPPAGRLWSANARMADGEALRLLGDGGYDFAARAGQIRDRLMALSRASEKEMLAIQLDEQALYMQHWRDLLVSVLTPEATAASARRAELRRHLEDWSGRASVDSVSYRMVRAFDTVLTRLIYEALTAPCKKADERFRYYHAGQIEGVVEAILAQRPPHLLDPRHASWDAQILAAVDTAMDLVMAGGRPMAAHTWGDRNMTRIQHPISLGVPMLSRWLDMPARPLPGDTNMPRVQGPTFGASERFAVSPGREQDGYFHMPCGQSGHPLSPHYGDGHDAWAEGTMTSFLPGPAASTLTLVPQS